MARYILMRLLLAAPTLLVIVTLSYFLMRVAPGGPFDSERPVSPQILQNLNRYYHFDWPLWRQYLGYLENLANGDLGPSFKAPDFTVNELFARALPISFELGGLSLLVAIVVGAGLGALAAFRQNSAIDYLVVGAATLGLTVPSFVVAPLLQLTFGLGLAWLPLGGWNDGALRNIVLPVVTLALPQIAVVARLSRGAVIEVLHSMHVRTLRAYGMPLNILLKHTMRSAALPIVSYLGPAAAALLTGSIVIETIFGLPGVGRYFVEGALSRDYTIVMGTVVLVAILVLLLNLCVDVIYALLDPRVRYE